MHRRTSLVAACAAIALGASALAVPHAVRAQAAAPVYYNPPKLVTHAKSTVPIAGKGRVIVQVLVKADGSFQVTKVLHSTNAGDNAAALDIARHSTYRPATRGTKKQTAYYDYTLVFTGKGGASADTGSQGGRGGSGGGLARYTALMNAGNYSAAQSGLRGYVAAHPSDTHAQVELGIANTFLSDYAGAVAAFDKAGTIPPNAKTVAAKAYGETAISQISAKQYPAAIAAAQRAVSLSPSFFSYNTLGIAQSNAGQNDAAIASLEKARALGNGPHVTAKDRARVATNLEATYLAVNNLDKAKTAASEALQLDPGSDQPGTLLATYYLKQAQAASSSGKTSDAAALLEQGAAGAPKAAATRLYARAAFDYLNAQPKPDNDKAKAAADKALALTPDDAEANFAAGIALANGGNSKDAMTYLNKADDAAKKAGNSDLAATIEKNIKQLSTKQ